MTRAGVCLMAALLLAACEREERRFSEPPASWANAEPPALTLSKLRPGSAPTPPQLANPYEENAWAISEGKRLYSAFNCVGCHAKGGGDIGPPLMDDEWVYGSEPAHVFASIVEGRPNGMPAFRGKIAEQQVWQLVAYVRALSGQVPQDAKPARDDHMQTKEAEQAKAREMPKDSSVPAAVQGTQ